MSNMLVTQVVERLNQLPDELQQQVLKYVDGLLLPGQRGVPGRQLLRFAGTIPADDLDVMRQAIEAGCEQVDTNEW